MTDPNRTRRVDVRLRLGLESRTLPKDLLICGPAGTGKTYGVLTVLHTLCRDYPSLRVLVCRQTRASLTESVLVTFEEEVLPADGFERLADGERRDHRSSYRYPNKSRIVLGGLDKPNRILSTSWDLVFINEAIETTEDAWEKLGSRLNRPGRDRRFGYLLGDTNPGDPSHWLRKRCEAGVTTLWDTTHAANPGLFGRGGWTAAWAPYREQLNRLRGTRRKRLKDGLWAAPDGQWFGAFDPDKHVTPAAVYDHRFPVHLAVDTGVHTGAVWFQIQGDGDDTTVTVFGDYYSCDVSAFDNAKAILGKTQEWCGGRFDVGRHDPAGNAASGFGGTTICSEYQRAGLRGLSPWLKFPGCINAGLALLGSFVEAVGDSPRFLVHPRCKHLIDALSNYKRKQKNGVLLDEPVDDQHPYSDLVDPLRSALLDRFPEGRKPTPKLRRVAAGKVF